MMRKDFADAAASYDSAAVLAREVGQRMAERLAVVRLAPQRFADIGCATGDGVRELQRRYPTALPLAVDFARPMLQAVAAHAGWWARQRGRAPRCINADARALPLAADRLDLVWSNLMLHWLPEPADLRLAFAEMQRVLTTGGLLHFAMLGPDTLKELRAAGAATPSFLDMHDIGDLLVAAGFADPVMEMEMLTLTYPTPRGFLADQRRLGVRDGLLGRLGWRQWRQVFAAWERVDGLLPARFEIVYGHAWKVAPRVALDGRAIVRFQKP
ncbi:MAG: methyltransferase domain-containing protein [Gammaproteobacteria bacterium]|nr:methyltransferase domain-containing protein [Rhodocyclaceae bacterium]MBU3910064.1 methyltransferase domain-containing protein [Gammaproteobacteria bacterium]MBU3988991.1 methyltransferase domain-containing protein [Gammaproteobacteria bacterium]MBU4003891.1 methyltransferase domain-containing protein [Gammaproteobacteria bacterium]MBU4022526.1 methyltransferase domain-containing protein [Gammaproteobacteria bacterium]